jgi:hypothetical protein
MRANFKMFFPLHLRALRGNQEGFNYVTTKDTKHNKNTWRNIIWFTDTWVK